MKLKIFIYLFVFTALILVFQLVNSSKVVNYQVEMIQEKIARIDTLRQQLDKSEQAYADDVYFSLDRNEEAMAYFEDLSIERPNHNGSRTKYTIVMQSKEITPWFLLQEQEESF